MRRHELSDAQWDQIEKLLPSSIGRPSKRGDRNFINAVIWIAKTGAPWRDLPERFGNWKAIYNRFRNWAKRDVWKDIFEAAAVNDDDIGGILDASVVRAHQDASGGKGGSKKNEIGRSRGGFSTKIHALVDTKGRPITLRITPGQQHESTVADDLIDYIVGGACLGDGGYDANRIIEELRQREIKPVIPSGKTRKKKRRHDKKLYRLRYLIECFFHNIKRFRRVATRYEKTASSFLAILHIGCLFQWIL